MCYLPADANRWEALSNTLVEVFQGLALKLTGAVDSWGLS